MSKNRTKLRKPATIRLDDELALWVDTQSQQSGRSDNWVISNWLHVARSLWDSNLPQVKLLRQLLAQGQAQRLSREAAAKAATEAAAATKKLKAELSKPQPKGGRGA